MTLEEKQLAEDRSAALAAFALGARADRIDKPGAGDKLRDFDLVFPDGHREPLEVTAHASRAAAATRQRLRDNPYSAAALERFWAANVGVVAADGEEVDVGKVHAEAPRQLRVLEVAGHTEYDPWLVWNSDADVRAAARALEALGVTSARSCVPTNADGDLRLWVVGISGGPVDVDLIADAVETQATNEGNQEKVAALLDAPRRHLFVTPALSGGLAYMALLQLLNGSDDRLPRLPVLPPAITTVWAAADAGAVFVTPPEPWQICRSRTGSGTGIANGSWTTMRRRPSAAYHAVRDELASSADRAEGMELADAV